MNTYHSLLAAAVACSLSFSACTGEDEPGTTPPPDTGGQGACPSSTSGPTAHSGAITADETWTAATSPHVVTGRLDIAGGATLTIEPCVEVRLAPGAAIAPGLTGSVPEAGTLRAEGTAQAPIRFVRDGQEAWGAINVRWPGQAVLRHVSIEGGGDNSSYDNASLLVWGDGEDAVRQNVTVEAVTVRHSKGVGVLLSNSGGFADGSSGLTVTGSGAGDARNPEPVATEASGLGLIPSGAYTGNARDEIRVATGGLLHDATVKNLGVPYRLAGIPGTRLTIRGVDSAHRPVATFEAGTVFEFDPGTAMRVGVGSASTLFNPGALVAVGTASAPVVFTSAAATPASGDWAGITFDDPNSVNRLEYARIEYAGGDCSCTLAACFPVADSPSESAILLGAVDDASYPDFIDNVTIAHSANHGVVCSYDSASVCPDLVSGNTFTDVAGCKQINNRDDFGYCDGRTICP